MSNITTHNDALPTVPEKSEREFRSVEGVISKDDQETDETLKKVTAILLKKLILEEVRGNDSQFMFELLEMLEVDSILGNTMPIENTLKRIHDRAEEIVEENFAREGGE